MLLSCLTSCFCFTRKRRYQLLFKCISTNPWIILVSLLTGEKLLTRHFTLFYVWYLKMSVSSLPVLQYGSNSRYTTSTSFQDYMKSSTWKSNRNTYFKNAARIAEITNVVLHYWDSCIPQAFILSIQENKTSQGLCFGTGASCPAARIQTAKPFHLPITRCLWPNYLLVMAAGQPSPQTVPRRCLEKH